MCNVMMKQVQEWISLLHNQRWNMMITIKQMFWKKQKLSDKAPSIKVFL